MKSALLAVAATAILATAVPAQVQTVVDVLKQQPQTAIFARIVERSGLANQLGGEGSTIDRVITVNGMRVVNPDVRASNGFVFLTDAVILR